MALDVVTLVDSVLLYTFDSLLNLENERIGLFVCTDIYTLCLRL